MLPTKLDLGEQVFQFEELVLTNMAWVVDILTAFTKPEFLLQVILKLVTLFQQMKPQLAGRVLVHVGLDFIVGGFHGVAETACES